MILQFDNPMDVVLCPHLRGVPCRWQQKSFVDSNLRIPTVFLCSKYSSAYLSFIAMFLTIIATNKNMSLRKNTTGLLFYDSYIVMVKFTRFSDTIHSFSTSINVNNWLLYIYIYFPLFRKHRELDLVIAKNKVHLLVCLIIT